MTTTFNRLTAGAAALTFARELTGRPYVWGGTWPESGGTDCSGLVQWAYGRVGVNLTRTTYTQYQQFQIPNSLPCEPGDLLFIAGSDGVGNLPGHVMMYVAPGEVFQAPYQGMAIGQYPADTTHWEYRTRPAMALPLPVAPPTKKPSPVELQHAGLVALSTPAQARTAIANGWTVWVWDGHWFKPAAGKLPKGTVEYANLHYTTKRG